MKKMFLAVAVACVTVFAQAGSVKWSTVAMYNADGAKVGGNATAYFYAITDQAAYDSLTDIWATFGDDVLNNAGAGAIGGKGVKTSLSKANITTTADATTTYYGAVIVTFGTGDDMKYYAEKKTALTGNDGNATVVFGGNTLDTAANAASSWTPTTTTGVPEPTSGLLLLVGGALLALRRKQK